jgi:hypothetical protein
MKHRLKQVSLRERLVTLARLTAAMIVDDPSSIDNIC